MQNRKFYIDLVEQHVTKLLSNLPSELQYHNYRHTLEVVEASQILASENQLSPDETEIVIIAAWFHDAGHLETYWGHEKASAHLAQKFLQSLEYPTHKLDQVVQCIQATTFPAKPQNLPEMVLCDADMYHLSQDYYEDRCFALKDELEYITNKSIPFEEWCSCNKEFLEEHLYFTPYAKKHLDSRKNENINKFIFNHLSK